MGDAAVYDLAAVVAERDALRKDFEAALEECKLLTHKVITCGVAASHPDASLAHTGAYKEKWDSPQAEEVRKLRAERDALKAEVEKLRDAVSWHRCSTHGDVDPTAWGCPECVRELRAEVALRKSEVELFRDKLKAQCDEVAKLKAELADVEHDLSEQRKLYCAELASVRAACAAKDAALRSARELLHSSEWPSLCNNIDTALSDTAGRNYIDATGAVEAVAKAAEWGADVEVSATVPDDWAGAPVKIVRVKP